MENSDIHTPNGIDVLKEIAIIMNNELEKYDTQTTEKKLTIKQKFLQKFKKLSNKITK